jgi:hypothetical protein
MTLKSWPLHSILYEKNSSVPAEVFFFVYGIWKPTLAHAIGRYSISKKALFAFTFLSEMNSPILTSTTQKRVI